MYVCIRQGASPPSGKAGASSPLIELGITYITTTFTIGISTNDFNFV